MSMFDDLAQSESGCRQFAAECAVNLNTETINPHP